MKRLYLTLGISAVLLALLLSSCGVTSSAYTKKEAFPSIYSEKPQSILIMPPINNTNIPEAKESMYTTLHLPLAERGYYVFSPLLVQELLQSESAADAELFIEGDLAPFKRVLDADAALFTIINKWNKLSLLSQIEVDIQYILRSTVTNETLFEKRANVTISYNSNSGNVFVDLLANAIATALTEHVEGARVANNYIIPIIPAGHYHPQYQKDGELPVTPGDIEGVIRR